MGGTASKSRTIVKPGYHLKPKYDLHFLRKKRTDHGKKSASGDLPLVSMIDMFSILVIYLIMNFSATGEIFFISKNLKLPEAKHAHQLENAPLITVTAEGVSLDTEKVGDNPINLTESDQNLPRLAAALRELRKLQETIRPNEPFKGNINIQADQKTPLVYIKRVMQVCILEGWTGIHFAVQGKDGEN
ncbi:MAG: ExbD/TolR family protein [Pseudobdellovibrionaceae bacterium]